MYKTRIKSKTTIRTQRVLIVVLCLLVISCFPNLRITAQELHETNTKIESLKLENLADISDSLKIENLFEIGIHYAGMDQLDSTIIYFIKARELGKKVGDLKSEIRFTLNIGSAYNDQKQHEKSIDYSREVIELCGDSLFLDYKCTAYYNVGVSYLDLNQHTKAEEALLSGIKIAKEIGEKDVIAGTYTLLASTSSERGNEDKCILYLDSAYLYKDYMSTRDMDIYLNNKGSYYIRMNQLDSALIYYNECIEHCQSVGSIEYEINGHKQVSYVYSKLGDYKKAYEEARKYYTMRDSVNLKTILASSIDSREKYETKEKEILIEKQDLELERQEIRERRIWFGGFMVVFFIGLFYYIKRRTHLAKMAILEKEKQLVEEKLSNQLTIEQLKFTNGHIQGQTDERKRIGRDLHDVIGSQLAAVKLNFSSIRGKTDQDSAVMIYDQSLDLLTKTVENLRGISKDLKKNSFDSEKLVTAVRDFAGSIQRATDMMINIHSQLNNKEVDSEILNQLYFVISELLTNAHKHAKAREINIDIASDEDELTVTVEDDGIGFDPKDESKINGIGLSNIRDRIDQLKGQFNIDSQKNRGTIFIIDIPLSA